MEDRRGQEPLIEEDLTATFLDWLEHEDAVIERVMFDAVVQATPSVVAGGAEAIAVLHESLRSHLPVVHAMVRETRNGRPPRLPPAADRWARSLAVAGVDLSDLILAYDAGGDAMLNAFAQCLRAGPYQLRGEQRADALETALDTLRKYINAALKATIAAYVHERDSQRRQADTRKLELIRQVLIGSISERDAEAALGYRLAATHIGFVAWSDALDSDRSGANGRTSTGAAVVPDVDKTVSAIRSAFETWQIVHATTHDGIVEGWLSVREKRAAQIEVLARHVVLPSNWRVAFGAPLPGVDGFRVSRRQALEGRRLDQFLDRSGASSVVFADVGVMALASGDIELTRAFVIAELGTLLDPQHRPLLATLAVWLSESGSPTRAARRLHLHPNTVVKRLDRVSRLLPRDLDPQSLRLRVAAELAPLVQADEDSSFTS